MIICKNCGVELEEGMFHCPLCGEPVTGDGGERMPEEVTNPKEIPHYYSQPLSQPQKKFTWDIVSIILLSGSIATFIIDFIINKSITWSEYPVAISLTIFTYISLFAFWSQKTIIQMTGGFILSSAFIVLLDSLTNSITWSFKLGVPLLFATNVIAATLTVVIRRSKHKGINLIAHAFLSAALLCVGIEGILSFFKTGTFHIEWSIIVAGCIIPIVIVLLFVHFRLKKGRSLKKTFHI